MTQTNGSNLTSLRVEKSSARPEEIRKRAFKFAVSIVKLCQYLNMSTKVSRSIIDQLLRSGTSVGANLEEAFASESRADFVHKNAISLKEARETAYWLRLILATAEFDEKIQRGIEGLKDECVEISRILGKIVVNTRAKDRNRSP